MRTLGSGLIIGCVLLACSSGGGGNAAVQRGVGAACSTNADCPEMGQRCLTNFKGGMCGIADCTHSSQCPTGSVCVADPDFSRNFCLLVCSDKPDCNINRPVTYESNCTSTLNAIDHTDAGADPKVCRPPS
ncbi:MAG TPA: hypothetical protein VL137_18360 [Polyangiaceae bacterium]|nr:hypothetical protein [Polyangiaceae bacterium]